jgi:malate/lactate dehydrogenase
VRLGREVVKQVVELELSREERAALDASAEAVRKGVEEVRAFL